MVGSVWAVPHDKGEAKRGQMTLIMRRLWLDRQGQDLIEYALLSATLAVVVAGFLPPSLMPSVSTIFSKITSVLK
jgi:Flp pilus assembly pilin Flp